MPPILVPASAKRIAIQIIVIAKLNGRKEHISNFLLIIDFEQAKVCWVHIEKINTFEDKIRYIMRYVVVI